MERGPTLCGPRLCLQPWEESALELCVRWFSDPQVRKAALAPHPWPWIRLRARVQEIFCDPQAVHFLIVLRAGDQPIGVCGLFDVDQEQGTAQLGVVIGEAAARGQGYGTEALNLLVAYAFDHLGLRLLRLQVREDNAAAVRVYEKLGFRKLTAVRGRWLWPPHKGKIWIMEKARDGGGAP